MVTLSAVREPLVVNFPVPAGLGEGQARHLIETWYAVLAPYDFVYLGGTTFALNPPCPSAEAFRNALPLALREEVEVEVLSRVLQEGAPDRARAVPEMAI